jgi:hypothetical protein
MRKAPPPAAAPKPYTYTPSVPAARPAPKTFGAPAQSAGQKVMGGGIPASGDAWPDEPPKPTPVPVLPTATRPASAVSELYPPSAIVKSEFPHEGAFVYTIYACRRLIHTTSTRGFQRTHQTSRRRPYRARRALSLPCSNIIMTISFPGDSLHPCQPPTPEEA